MERSGMRNLIMRPFEKHQKKILFFCDIQYFCAVKEMITIPRSKYEQMKRKIAELQTMVRQLGEVIALLKSYTISTVALSRNSLNLNGSKIINHQSKIKNA